jgi:sulfite exporter TauE/SafE
MCGPIALMLPLGNSKGIKKFSLISSYHLGRMISYGIIGLVLGSLGMGVSLFGYQQQLSIATGVLIILFALFPAIGKSSLFKAQWIYKPISKIKSSLGASLKKNKADTLLSIGFLNGFLPCGLVYMAMMGALANGSTSMGALYMVFFGLGTVPLMSTLIYSASLIQKKYLQNIKKLIPFFVILLGILFILRGLGLGIPYISPKQNHQMAGENSIECHDTTNSNSHGEELSIGSSSKEL